MGTAEVAAEVDQGSFHIQTDLGRPQDVAGRVETRTQAAADLQVLVEVLDHEFFQRCHGIFAGIQRRGIIVFGVTVFPGVLGFFFLQEPAVGQ